MKEKNLKFAYLVIAHNEPKIFATLISLFDDERNDIYVHVDKKEGITCFRVLTCRLGMKKNKLVRFAQHAL